MGFTSEQANFWWKQWKSKNPQWLIERNKKISIKHKGKKLSLEHRKKLSENHAWKGKKRPLQSLIMKQKYLEGKWKPPLLNPNSKIELQCENCNKKFIDYKSDKRKYCSQRCYWIIPKTKECIEKRLQKALEHRWRRPTSLEQHFIALIQKHNLPYKYVGNGNFWIEHKNPDFVNINGEKICIEVRNKDTTYLWDKVTPQIYEQNLIHHYQKYGWKCLVLFAKRTSKRNWQFELSNNELISILF